MPLVKSKYKAPLLLRNGHLSTIYSAKVRRVNGLNQERERLDLADGDFLDLDWSWSEKETDKLIILLHGLEGNANRHYIVGSAHYFNTRGFDAIGVNFRGCSGEPNKLYRSYHSGATDDLASVVNHIVGMDKYKTIVIKGISLGGNVLLKYLGETDNLAKYIKAAIAVSVPCSLMGSCVELHKLKNKLYHDNFKYYLVGKLKQKQKVFPERVSKDEIRSIRTLKDFDDVYTSKAHGFRDAEDYYESCSSLYVLDEIRIPTLLLNARNDSFLDEDCYPVVLAQNHQHLYLEMPERGGHVGFNQSNGIQYNESRAFDFVNSGMS